jgi:hypothetical protein
MADRAASVLARLKNKAALENVALDAGWHCAEQSWR